jgi:hypothetical protein
MRDGNTLQKQTILVRVPVSACNFFFFNMFYTHKHSIKLCSNTSIISLIISLYVSEVIFSPLAGLEMRVTQIFLLLFRNSFFFVYRHSDLEVSCSNGTKSRHGETRCCLRVVAGI